MSIETIAPEYSNEVFAIVKKCKSSLEEQGVFQWTESYPSLSDIREDSTQGQLYGYKQDGKYVGVITLNSFEDPEYGQVSWEDSGGRVLVIHRLAVHPDYQKRGIAGKLMDFAEEYAVRNNYTSIRLDAYSKNENSLRFYDRRAYQKRGEIYFPGRPFLFICYEKVFRHNAA